MMCSHSQASFARWIVFSSTILLFFLFSTFFQHSRINRSTFLTLSQSSATRSKILLLNMGAMTRRSLLSSLLLLLGCSFVQAYLTPGTSPEQIIESQLAALRKDNMSGVYEFASPGNKAQVGSLDRFSQMVKSGPYRFLVNHRKADILLASNLAASKQYLVRVMPDDYPNKAIVEYWWSLSRVRSGPNEGCYMVDAVIPNA